jgi:hypothetical protein
VIYVVLGMHKSGTTLVSQILHHSGINMGEFDGDISYDKGNKYERQSCLALDMEILGTCDFGVLDVTAHGEAQMTAGQREKMQDIISQCQSEHENWGFKDPRCALTYNLWAQELPPHKIIAVYRDPAQVWPRFRWNGKRKYHTNFNRAYIYLQRWHEHNTNILKFLKEGSNEYLMINYHDLMSGDKDFIRLQEFVGQDLVDRRNLGLYRSKSGGDFFLKAADWWLEKKAGLSCRKAIESLDAYI